MDRELDKLRNIRIEDYTYNLPDERIAKFPLAEREASKLLIYRGGRIEESRFSEVRHLLGAGQMLVFNNTKVIHARLFFRKATGAVIEVFCLERICRSIMLRILQLVIVVNGVVWWGT